MCVRLALLLYLCAPKSNSYYWLLLFERNKLIYSLNLCVGVLHYFY